MLRGSPEAHGGVTSSDDEVDDEAAAVAEGTTALSVGNADGDLNGEYFSYCILPSVSNLTQIRNMPRESHSFYQERRYIFCLQVQRFSIVTELVLWVLLLLACFNSLKYCQHRFEC